MDLLLLALLGGLLALDATSVGQFMVSRPLVAGLLAGALLGDPALGVLVGAILELYLLVAFPTGGARFPEAATATVVAVAGAVAGGSGGVALAVAAGLVWGQVGGMTITLLRDRNGRRVPDPSAASVTRERIVRFHLGAMALDFLRGALVTGVGVALIRAAEAPVRAVWPLPVPDSVGLLLVGGAVSAGIFLQTLGRGRRRAALFGAGLVLGLAGATFL